MRFFSPEPEICQIPLTKAIDFLRSFKVSVDERCEYVYEFAWHPQQISFNNILVLVIKKNTRFNLGVRFSS